MLPQHYQAFCLRVLLCFFFVFFPPLVFVFLPFLLPSSLIRGYLVILSSSFSAPLLLSLTLSLFPFSHAHSLFHSHTHTHSCTLTRTLIRARAVIMVPAGYTAPINPQPYFSAITECTDNRNVMDFSRFVLTQYGEPLVTKDVDPTSERRAREVVVVQSVCMRNERQMRERERD